MVADGAHQAAGGCSRALKEVRLAELPAILLEADRVIGLGELHLFVPGEALGAVLLRAVARASGEGRGEHDLVTAGGELPVQVARIDVAGGLRIRQPFRLLLRPGRLSNIQTDLQARSTSYIMKANHPEPAARRAPCEQEPGLATDCAFVRMDVSAFRLCRGIAPASARHGGVSASVAASMQRKSLNFPATSNVSGKF